MAMKLDTFDDVQASIHKNRARPFSLLLGNGFSMAYDPSIFSYNALYDFVTAINDPDLTTILGVVETRNFEIIMRHLDTFDALIGAMGNYPKLRDRIQLASSNLKNGLLDAVRALHPEHVFTISEDQSVACSNFLKLFLDTGGNIYSTNYDLLLYWVLMRNAVVDHVDGCGRELENADDHPADDEQVWSDLLWGKHRDDQNVFYLHGALQFFDDGVNIVKETYDSYHYLLENIHSRMEQGEYPVFVAAGDGRQKLAHIMHNRYLTHCYERLCQASGTLVSFGFNFGPYDEHIIEAINRAARQPLDRRLWSIYIGTYSDADRDHIRSISHKFRPKVRIYDARTVPVWG